MSRTRQIELTRHDVRPYEPLFLSDTRIEYAWELYFDVDKYFGTNVTATNDCVNFYTIYDINTDRLTAYYVCTNDDIERNWELTSEEEKYLREILDEYCADYEPNNTKVNNLKEFFEYYYNSDV